MKNSFRPHLGNFVVVFLNYIIIFSKNKEEHVELRNIVRYTEKMDVLCQAFEMWLNERWNHITWTTCFNQKNLYGSKETSNGLRLSPHH